MARETRQSVFHDASTDISDTLYTISESPKLAVTGMLPPTIHTQAGAVGFLNQVSPTSRLTEKEGSGIRI